MSLSRKHFRQIAEMIQERNQLNDAAMERAADECGVAYASGALDATEWLREELSRFLQSQNVNFDAQKFEDACNTPPIPHYGWPV